MFRFQFERDAAERWIYQGRRAGGRTPSTSTSRSSASSAATAAAVRPGNVEFARKDVVRPSTARNTSRLLVHFRDMVGGYPVHCHNTVHEDHQMMMLFKVAQKGDNKTRP